MQAKLVMVFSTSVTLTLPPGAPSLHAPHCCCCLVVKKPQLIKTFILFPILLSQCHAGPLAIILIDISACLRQCMCVRARVLACVNMKEPRAKYAGYHWSAVLCPPPQALLSRGVEHLYQMARGVSLSGCVQVKSSLRCLTNNTVGFKDVFVGLDHSG